MIVTESIIMAVQNLWTKPLRSILTSLGIIIGVFSLIAMIGIGEGTRHKVIRDIERLGGSELISIHPKPEEHGDAKGPAYENDELTRRDLEVILQSSDLIDRIAPIISEASVFTYGKHQFGGRLIGVTPVYTTIRNWAIEKGRFILSPDLRIYAKICVIGAEISEILFKFKDPVGKEITVGKELYTVVGVMEEREVEGARWMNKLVMIPLITLEKQLQVPEFFSEILIKAKTTDDVQLVEKQIQQVLELLHAHPEKFNVHSQVEIIRTVYRSTLLLRSGFAIIAAIVLLVGGIGIMNLMLMSIAERTREIGIRKAVGAKDRDILVQFLTEAVIMSLIGSGFGIVSGLLGGQLLSDLISGMIRSRVEFFIGIRIVGLVILFTGIVGVMAGVYPAIRASRLDPSMALNYE